MEHRWFQRMRRIKQLGLTYFVYPGATHNRFQHALGSAHLMNQAIEVICSKSYELSAAEKEAAIVAIMMHDIGHGPFSHALENSIVHNISHENLSMVFMKTMNEEFNGRLSLAIQIFNNQYHRKFLHRLISGHLDMDRMDYLRRDSFYTGVVEGIVGSERIIKMLKVENDELYIEAKGIYSVEKFLIARRLMYLQVYLHKTVISAEFLLIKILQRAKYLAGKGIELFATPSFKYFLKENVNSVQEFLNNNMLASYACLDDYDIFSSIKVWTNHKDKVLSFLTNALVNRNLFKIEISREKISTEKVEQIKELVVKKLGFSRKEADFVVCCDSFTNNAYSAQEGKINIIFNNGEIKDIIEASELLDDELLSKDVIRYFISYPKGLI